MKPFPTAWILTILLGIVFALLTYAMTILGNSMNNSAPIETFPDFNPPPLWRQIKNTPLIVDEKGDTLLIHHRVTHSYAFKITTAEQRRRLLNFDSDNE